MSRRWVPVPGFKAKSGGQLLMEVGKANSFLFRVYIGRIAGKRHDPSQAFRGTLREAKVAFAKFYAEKRASAHLSLASTSMPTTLQGLVTEWLNLTRSKVAAKTHESYRDALSNYVLPTLGTKALKRITTRDLEHLFAAMQEGRLPKPADGDRGWRGGPLSSRTVRLTRAVLRQVFDQARRWRCVEDNPVADTVAPRLQPTFPKTALDRAEYAAFMAAAAGEHYYVFLRLLFDLGLRPGEAAGLRWEDVDLDRGVVVVRHSVGLGDEGPGSLKDPKTRSSVRPAHLAPVLVEILRGHRILQAELGHDATGHVVTNTRGERLVPNRFDRKVLDRIAQKAGIRKRVVLYTGRHTAGTLMHEAGVPLKVIGDALGHTDVNTTAGTYVHASADLTRRSMNGYWSHLQGQDDDGERRATLAN